MTILHTLSVILKNHHIWVLQNFDIMIRFSEVKKKPVLYLNLWEGFEWVFFGTQKSILYLIYIFETKISGRNLFTSS